MQPRRNLFDLSHHVSNDDRNDDQNPSGGGVRDVGKLSTLHPENIAIWELYARWMFFVVVSRSLRPNYNRFEY